MAGEVVIESYTRIDPEFGEDKTDKIYYIRDQEIHDGDYVLYFIDNDLEEQSENAINLLECEINDIWPSEIDSNSFLEAHNKLMILTVTHKPHDKGESYQRLSVYSDIELERMRIAGVHSPLVKAFDDLNNNVPAESIKPVDTSTLRLEELSFYYLESLEQAKATDLYITFDTKTVKHINAL